ncbi:SOUL family heme-binding protein [Roseomonas fluvialis]|uniref:Heme-binding protein n=1 Tax=Roseomonas fluvialis TaxID=1750527 RepID=A0ABN6P0C6_9PROT|nr:heme-binding protein [Roseomonas fluvialis]BDG72029.1 heme-binding protein [Roseomonas fluvialis]
MALRLPAILSSLLLGACSVVGIRSGTEEPRFEVVETIGDIEIRRYAPRIAAETTVPGAEDAARNEGFRRLAGYIFGGNARRDRIAMTAPVAQSRGERIAMTAPVAQAGDADGWRIRFFMPARYTLDTLPVPDDASVTLVTVPEETVAVLRFSGLPRAEAVASNMARLNAALAASPWVPTGPVQAWFYDPPWTVPALRRNEVVAPVARR